MQFIGGAVVGLIIGVLFVFNMLAKALHWTISNTLGLLVGGNDSPTAKVSTQLPVAQASDNSSGQMPVARRLDAEAHPGFAIAMPRATAQQAEIADFHVSVLFNSSFSASVSVFKKSRLIKRRLRATSQAASLLLKQLYLRDAFDLPEIQLAEGQTVEQAILDTEAIGHEFIKNLISRKDPMYFKIGMKSTDPLALTAPPASAEDTARALALLRRDVEETKSVVVGPQLKEMPIQNVPAVTTSTERKDTLEAKSVTTGRVVAMGLKQKLFRSNTPGKKRPADTFEVTIQTRGDLSVSMCGVRLEELFHEHAVKIGDEVEIESLGYTAIKDGQDGESGRRRNEYRVRVLQRAAEAATA